MLYFAHKHRITVKNTIFDIKVKDGMKLLDIYRNKENMFNSPIEMVFEKIDKMIILV
ncbi:hypothetical protein [Methanomethylovorans sp.]|uniref:hypothetical protein n=1 Tax=Methanomethylovorans sp. TaxID=2758717 RepID=UPI00351CB256